MIKKTMILTAILFTLVSCNSNRLTSKDVTERAKTAFRNKEPLNLEGADLSNLNLFGRHFFNRANLKNADLSGVIGYKK